MCARLFVCLVVWLCGCWRVRSLRLLFAVCVLRDARRADTQVVGGVAGIACITCWRGVCGGV